MPGSINGYLFHPLQVFSRSFGVAQGFYLPLPSIGIKREEDVLGVDGEDAIYLWESFKLSKNPRYLKKLIKYNEEDVINMVPIADYVIPLLWEQILI